jgi:hypothetical protein
VVASLIVGGVFLLAMVIASVRGAVILPADARIPVHAGSVEHCYMAPKKAGLVIWPGAGALAFGVLGGVGRMGGVVWGGGGGGGGWGWGGGGACLGWGSGEAGGVRGNGCDGRVRGPYHLHVPRWHVRQEGRAS